MQGLPSLLSSNSIARVTAVNGESELPTSLSFKDQMYTFLGSRWILSYMETHKSLFSVCSFSHLGVSGREELAQWLLALQFDDGNRLSEFWSQLFHFLHCNRQSATIERFQSVNSSYFRNSTIFSWISVAAKYFRSLPIEIGSVANEILRTSIVYRPLKNFVRLPPYDVCH